MAPVETIHRNPDGVQVTVKRVVLEDATGELHTYEFEGPPDGDLDDFEFNGEGEPTDRALEELAKHFGADIDEE